MISMNKNIKLIYVFLGLMFFFIIMFKFIVLNYFRKYSVLVEVVFFAIISLIMTLRFGLQRDKSYYKGNTIRIVIISLFSFLLIIYSLGLFTGFSKFPYLHDIRNVYKNIIPIIAIVSYEEIIRFIVAKNSQYDVKPMIILTGLYISLDIIMEISYSNITNFEQLFKFFCIICLPAVAKHSLYSFITYKISIVPTLILRLSYDLYIYLIPIFPSLGNYLIAVFGVVFPYIIYRVLISMLNDKEKRNDYVKKISRKIILIPIIIFLIIIVLLVSGIFKYKMIAIGSNSMHGVYDRGDAVIYLKYSSNNIKDIKVGDILVFQTENVIITHRVIEIINDNNEIIFRTKGDNNNKADLFLTKSSDVLGVVKCKVKYVGYPTIWLTEIFEENK